jgi:hypothetical protein
LQDRFVYAALVFLSIMLIGLLLLQSIAR